MFDIIKQKKEYIPYDKTITVNEHRAPTDDSVKLLREMEEKITESVFKRVPVETNIFKGEVIFWRCPADIFPRYTLIFSLNDVKYVIHKELKSMDIHVNKAIGEILEEFKNDIAEIILKECMTNFKITG